MTEFIKALSGHSGCKLSLYKDDKSFFVRKQSGTIKYNYRLRKQFIKQQKFNADSISKPQIIRFGTTEKLFFFDMEFLNCKTFAEYLPLMNPAEISTYIDILFKALPIPNSHQYNQPQIFQHKIAELNQKISNPSPTTQKALDICSAWQFTDIPLSYCHGDLTLENIMITASNKIYLIDFLDSFCNSWMIDIAKLLQDLEVKWSYRRLPADINRDIRLLIAKDTLLNRLRIMDKGQIYLRQIYHLLLLNLLRILPYTNDHFTYNFLQNAISQNISILNQEVL